MYKFNPITGKLFSSIGIVGPQGEPGADGADGATGATGSTGAAGANGTNGTNGTNGATGATGADGIGTAASVGVLVDSLTAKANPVDADQLGLMDSAASNILKKLSWANIKATLKTYFDTLYPAGSGTSTGTNTGDNATNTQYSGFAASKENTGVAASAVSTHSVLTTGIHGAGANSLIYSDDSRLTDPRTPTAHNQAESTVTFTDITTGNAQTTQHGFLPKLGGGTANFLRADGTWAAPAAGSFTASQTTVDFGTTPVDDKEFVITDAACSPTSKVVAAMAYVDTADNTADEIATSKVCCSVGVPAAGSFTLSVFANDGPIAGKFAVNYALG
jgi:hypothetical protein